MTNKIFIITACLDEGVSEMWHFKAADELSVSQYILDNPENFDSLFDKLGVGSKYAEVSPHLLLKLMENAHIDGDSAYGFEIYEMPESDIVDVPTVAFTPSSQWVVNFISREQLAELGEVKIHHQWSDAPFVALFENIKPLNASQQAFFDAFSKNHYHFTRIRNEATITNFIEPLIQALQPSQNTVFYNRLIQTTLNNQSLETTIDFGIMQHEQPIFILENCWNRPDSVDSERVLIAKKLMLMNLYPSVKTLFGGFFINHSSFYFTVLHRLPEGGFEFYSSKELNFERDIEKTIAGFKWLLQTHPSV